jgi:hypothetical protein
MPQPTQRIRRGDLRPSLPWINSKPRRTSRISSKPPSTKSAARMNTPSNRSSTTSENWNELSSSRIRMTSLQPTLQLRQVNGAPTATLEPIIQRSAERRMAVRSELGMVTLTTRTMETTKSQGPNAATVLKRIMRSPSDAPKRPPNKEN